MCQWPFTVAITDTIDSNGWGVRGRCGTRATSAAAVPLTGCAVPISVSCWQYLEDWLGADDNTATAVFSFFIVLTNVFGVVAALHSDWVTGAYVVQVGFTRVVPVVSL